MSDVILVVEESEFHVHKVILAMCSPVFERMFTSDFKEKEAQRIPLPEKKSEDIKEMLLVLYPFAKPVTGRNVDFLLSLAQEYQIDKLTARCEEYLLEEVGEDDYFAVARLITAQSYNLEKLELRCIDLAKNLSVEDLKDLDEDEGSKLSLENKAKIFEKRSIHLEIAFSKIIGSYREALRGIGHKARSELNVPDYRAKLNDDQCFTYMQRAKEEKYNSYLSHGKTLLEELRKALKSVKLVS